MRSFCALTRPSAGRVPPSARRISASGRPGAGRKVSKRRAPSRSAWSGSGSSAATRSPSSATTGRGSIGRYARPDARRRSGAGLCRRRGRRDGLRLGHAEATLGVVQDQEQVDKIISVRDRLPMLARLLYDEPRGLGDYDEPGLAPLAAIAAKGRAALADPAVAGGRRLIAAGKGSTSPSFSTPRARPAAPRASS